MTTSRWALTTAVTLGAAGCGPSPGGVVGDSAVLVIGPGAKRPIQLRGRFKRSR